METADEDLISQAFNKKQASCFLHSKDKIKRKLCNKILENYHTLFTHDHQLPKEVKSQYAGTIISQ